MIRLDSMAQEIAENLKTDIPGFLGMELHAADETPLDDGGKQFAMFRHRDRVFGHWRDEAVREVHLRTGRNARDNRCRTRNGEAVPADVRSLQRLMVGIDSRQAVT